LEEFSSLPSAKLTVDEFREIWFQNAADPPSFATKPKAALKDTEEEEYSEQEDVPAIDSTESNVPGTENPETQVDANEELADKEAEAAFLEDLVQDKELEDEIERHLNKNQFQQALAEMAGPFQSTEYSDIRITKATDQRSGR
jgi:hypothetical protein